MRIGIFTESYEPIINGVSVCVSTLRDELTRLGHEVFIFAPDFNKHVDKYKNVFRMPSTHTILMKDYPFPIPYAPKTYKAFRNLNLDIVHTQTPFVLGILGAKWAKKAGIPLVSTNHTLYTEYAHYVPVRPKSLTVFFLVTLMKWYYSGCNAVVVPSNPVKEILISYGIKKHITAIKTGVVGAGYVSDEDKHKTRELYCNGSDNPLILYVGRIAREKNLSMLLNAMKTVIQSHPKAVLLVVGGGPALNETKEYVSQLKLEDNVKFTGMLNRDEINPLYAASDMFVFPSTTETQGLAICEALSAGLPVVTVNAGGIPENIEKDKDGFLTNDNYLEFAEKICYLIRDKAKRAEMAERAKLNSANFSIERMACEFESFYSAVIKQHSKK